MLVDNVRKKRLQVSLTQEGLAERSGVLLTTLSKFEQKSLISMDSFFLKLLSVAGGLEEIVDVLKPKEQGFNSIDDVLKSKEKSITK